LYNNHKLENILKIWDDPLQIKRSCTFETNTLVGKAFISPTTKPRDYQNSNVFKGDNSILSPIEGSERAHEYFELKFINK